VGWKSEGQVAGNYFQRKIGFAQEFAGFFQPAILPPVYGRYAKVSLKEALYVTET